MRTAQKERITKETKIKIKLNIDGSGEAKINSGIGFMNHMLELFAFWGHFDLTIDTIEADLSVDKHHTNEDIGIVLGQAFKEALGDKAGIKRFGSVSVPMEEVVANVTVDISGRGFLKFKKPMVKFTGKPLLQNQYSLDDAEHFFESFAKHLGINLNIGVEPYNPDIHVMLEPVFKALGIALDQATQIDPRRKGVPSTKGVID